MRLVPILTIAVLATAGVLVAPGAEAACEGPGISATISPDGALVVHGSGFGIQCYDAGEPPEGEGPLGPPARDITVVVRQSNVEFLVARGDADTDYTFHVEITDPPPMAGDVRVEARFANQEGFNSYLIATEEVNLPASESVTAGTQVVNFASHATSVDEGHSGNDVSSRGIPATQAEGKSGGLITSASALLAGLLLGAGGMVLWSRRQNATTCR